MNATVYNTDGNVVAPEGAQPREGITETLDALLDADEWVNVYFDADEKLLLHRFMVTIYRDGQPPRANNYYLEYHFDDGVTPEAIAGIAETFERLRQDNWKAPPDKQLENPFLNPNTLQQIRALDRQSFARDEVLDAILQDGENARLRANLYDAYWMLGKVAAGETGANVVFTTDFDEYLYDLAPVVIELGEYETLTMDEAMEQQAEAKRREILEEEIEDKKETVRQTLDDLSTAGIGGDSDVGTLLDIGEHLRAYLDSPGSERPYVAGDDEELRRRQVLLYDCIDFFTPHGDPSIYDRLTQTDESFVEEHATSYFETVESSLVEYQRNTVENYLDSLESSGRKSYLVDHLSALKREYLADDDATEVDDVTDLSVDPAFEDVAERIDERIAEYRAGGVEEYATEEWDVEFADTVETVASEYNFETATAKRMLLDYSGEVTLPTLLGTFVRLHPLKTLFVVLVLAVVFVGAAVGAGYGLVQTGLV